MSKPGGLLLFHGAGGDRDHRLFLLLEKELSLPVERFNFPYRDKGPGRRPPDRMPKLLTSIEERVDQFCADHDTQPEDLVLGGRSLGGRAASVAVADGLGAAGLLLLSYPLHPVGKPEKLRTDHFDRINVPVLLVQGESDPFGRPAEFAEHLGQIPGPVTELWLERTGHDPVARHDSAVVAGVSAWLDQLAATP